MRAFRITLLLGLLGLISVALHAAETLPPKPTHYFNDYAQLIPAATARALENRLEQFERETSNQLVVAVFPRMNSKSSVEDYTVRVAESWGVGQKKRDNGAILFVFLADRQLYIQVGYGLEGALPDALAHQIIENEIKPRFRSGDYAGGIDAGTRAIMAATKGEYRGTGRTRGDASGRRVNSMPIGLIIVFIVVSMLLRGGRRMVFGHPRSHTGFGGGGWGGWSGGGGGGGGFSGGGGSFGGGGAGGRW